MLISGIIFSGISELTVAEGVLLFPKTALEANELGLVINENDPLSRKIGRYYQERRGIPEENVVRVQLSRKKTTAGIEEFHQAFAQVEKALPEHVQALALAWTWPYRVGCMSITMAFASGYQEHFCAQPGPDVCKPSGKSPYFATKSRRPYQDFKLRPTMLLAALNYDEARLLIERGISADKSASVGTAYLLSTWDKNRTIRDKYFSQIKKYLGARINVEVLKKNALKDKDDVLFYFTGIKEVDALETLHFLPGAVADHLTSSGGLLHEKEEGSQMSILRWLEAGATGSYGTVIEPCNYPQKFPHPGLLMDFYLAGSTLIEAYWKSVAWPGQGVFIGEPLAAPFKRLPIKLAEQTLTLTAAMIGLGKFQLFAATDIDGPYKNTGRTITFTGTRAEPQHLTGLDQKYYRLVRLPQE